MLIKTNHTVSLEYIKLAVENVPFDIKESIVINQPTGDFFYDNWVIKDEYKNSIWDTLLSTLKESDIGQARLIALTPGEVYQAHADIDDRWHLNLLGEQSYLIDLDNEKMFKLSCDGNWYLMNTGYLHTACNFGPIPRLQLVVRKLLKHNNIREKTTIKIEFAENLKSNHRFHTDTSYRYMFDQIFSPWLNRANKNNLLDNFKVIGNTASFDTNISELNYLKSITPPHLKLTADIDAS